MTLYLVLSDSWVQTFGARMAADYLSKELGTTFRIGGFHLSFRNGIVIEDILVKDTHDSTLFAAAKLGVKPIWFSLSGRNITLHKIFIEQSEFQLLKHPGDSTLNLVSIINHFSSKDTLPAKPDTAAERPLLISCNYVNLKNVRFHYQDLTKPPVPHGMDYANIDVRDINLDISHVLIEGDTINALIESLSANERCGLNLQSFHGDCNVSPRFIKVDDLRIKTDNSDLALDFAFLYPGYDAFNDFLKRITIRAKIDPSEFDLADVGFFAPEIREMKNKFRFDGDVDGTVSKFRAKDFRVAFGKSTIFNGNILAIGLPLVTATWLDMNIKTLITTAEDLDNFKLPGEGNALVLPDIIKNLGLIQLDGELTGFYNDFVSKATITTDLGSAKTNLSLRQKTTSSIFAYKGELDLQSLDIGTLTGNPKTFGRVTLRANLDGEGLSLDNADLLMQVHVDSARLNHYTYKNFDINGSLIREKFFGDLNVNDPNLNLEFHGMADFFDSIPVFKFTSSIDHAQLFSLGLLKRNPVEELSVNINADFSGSNVDNGVGSLNLQNISYREGHHTAMVDSLLVTTELDSIGQKSYFIKSDAFDADFTGEFAFTSLIPSLTAFINNYMASLEMSDDTTQYHISGQELNYWIQFKKTDDITAIFLPFLKIAPETFLEGTYNEEKKVLSMTGHSPVVNVSGIDLEEWFIEAETRTDNLSVNTGCAQLIMDKTTPSDSVYVQIDTLLLAADMRHDSILFDLSSKMKKNHSFLNGFFTSREDGSVKIKVDEMDILIAGEKWHISENNFVILDPSYIEINDLVFTSDEQFISIDGKLTKNQIDTLDLQFNKVDLSEFDYFFSNPNLNIDGILTGELKLSDVYHEFSLISDLKLDAFRFNNQLLGDAVFNVHYNRLENRFDILSKIIYTGNIGQSVPFSLEGSYFLADPDPRLDFDLKLKNLNLKMLKPFVSGFMSKLSGLASGEVKITGSPSHPSLKGELKMQRTEFNFSYLNVPYSFSDVIRIDPDKLEFNNITLYDSLGDKAHLNGFISHNYFKDLFLNLNISMDDFSAFHNTKAQNSVFYGKARASGTVEIKGPLEHIQVVVRASTGTNTKVVIPINLTQEVGQVDYILFEQPDDTLETKQRVLKPDNVTGLTLDIKLDVRPNAEVQVFFPDQLGNITAMGTGHLAFGMTPSTPFNLHGRYSITRGSFLFQMQNLIRLPFTIKSGSSISWNGDPADANISLSAIYKTKVPLTGLTSEADQVSGRTPVDCIIRLNGKLMNPIMSFGLEMPNAQQQAINIVYNAIDTNDQSEMTQQVLYILVMNQFKPVTRGENMRIDMGETSLAIVTNQISSWLSGMSQNVNIGVNYKPGSATSTQDLDMSVSTQLFDDRLLIDGTFGMSSYTNTSYSNASTIVGDINIEYILTRNRRWRVRAFNRTNTIDVLYNYAPYTQGVGISFQRDFSTWDELFRRSKDSKKKKK